MKSTGGDYALLEDDEEQPRFTQLPSRSRSPRPWRFVYILVGALVLSLSFNVYLILGTRGIGTKTQFAKLSFDQLIPWVLDVNYGNYEALGLYNSTRADELWEAYQVGPGNVALDHGYSDAMGLPRGQPFPWNKEKSIYLLNGYHSLHCLKKVRRAVEIAHRNGTPQDPHDHVMHCLDKLRQDVLCYADDTPMYTSTNIVADSGNGQTRQCRDWSKLEQWAADHTACYVHINETTGVDNMLERFKYCPKGTPEAARVRKHFGFSDDWYEKPPLEEVPPY